MKADTAVGEEYRTYTQSSHGATHEPTGQNPELEDCNNNANIEHQDWTAHGAITGR